MGTSQINKLLLRLYTHFFKAGPAVWSLAHLQANQRKWGHIEYNWESLSWRSTGPCMSRITRKNQVKASNPAFEREYHR